MLRDTVPKFGLEVNEKKYARFFAVNSALFVQNRLRDGTPTNFLFWFKAASPMLSMSRCRCALGTRHLEAWERTQTAPEIRGPPVR